MSTPEAQRTLIDEIDDRQNELLEQLAALNTRVEELLNTCLQAREQERVDAGEGESSIPGGPNAPISQSPEVTADPQEC